MDSIGGWCSAYECPLKHRPWPTRLLVVATDSTNRKTRFHPSSLVGCQVYVKFLPSKPSDKATRMAVGLKENGDRQKRVCLSKTSLTALCQRKRLFATLSCRH